MSNTATCSINGCTNPAKSRGWCTAHYARFRKHGDPEYVRQRQQCSIDGCESLVESRGMCHLHYHRWWRTGDAVHLERVRGRLCDVDGCDEPHSSKGKCRRHAAQVWRAERRAAAPPKPPAVSTLPCTVEDCDQLQVAKGVCQTHYYQLRRNGEITSKVRTRADGTISNGYRFLYRPSHPQAYANGYVPEHRMVMADILGRTLLPGENPHHRNGDRADNRPSNLELWTTHQPKGQRVADKVAWAREILDMYGDLPPEVLG